MVYPSFIMSLLGPNLEAFLAVVRSRSVTHAAQELRIGQTGVTQRIRNLEKELGTTLFVRSRRGMQPTETGQALLRYCESVRSQEGELLSALHGAAVTQFQRLVITGPSSVLRSRFIRGLVPALKRFPMLRVTLYLSDTLSGMERLRTGEAHLAVVRRDEVVNEVDSKILKPERYVLVGPPQWKGRSLKDILAHEAIIDFDPTDMMTFDYLRKFDLLDLWRGDRHYANNTDALAALITEGLGFSVLSEEFAEHCIQKGHLIHLNGKKAFEYPIALAWYPRKEMPPWLSTVIEALLRA